MNTLVGDTIYFSVTMEAPAQNYGHLPITRHGEWMTSTAVRRQQSDLMELLVGDTLYFSADDGSTGRELWAHNTSNNSDPWQVSDIEWRGPQRSQQRRS